MPTADVQHPGGSRYRLRGDPPAENARRERDRLCLGFGEFTRAPSAESLMLSGLWETGTGILNGERARLMHGTHDE